jgi:hypothetical protein
VDDKFEEVLQEVWVRLVEPIPKENQGFSPNDCTAKQYPIGLLHNAVTKVIRFHQRRCPNLWHGMMLTGKGPTRPMTSTVFPIPVKMMQGTWTLEISLRLPWRPHQN